VRDAGIDLSAVAFQDPIGFTDIEGKTRDAHPDVGAFEYAGLPLLRGPLTADEVGPNAVRESAAFSLETSAVYITEVSLASQPGAVDARIDGVTTGGVEDDVELRILVDDTEVHRSVGFPASVALDT